MDEPVMIGTFRIFMDYRINYLGLHHIMPAGIAQIYKIRRILRYTLVLLHLTYERGRLRDGSEIYKSDMHSVRFMPHDHNSGDDSGCKQRVPASMRELKHVGSEKQSFERYKKRKESYAQRQRHPSAPHPQ